MAGNFPGGARLIRLPIRDLGIHMGNLAALLVFSCDIWILIRDSRFLQPQTAAKPPQTNPQKKDADELEYQPLP